METGSRWTAWPAIDFARLSLMFVRTSQNSRAVSRESFVAKLFTPAHSGGLAPLSNFLIAISAIAVSRCR